MKRLALVTSIALSVVAVGSRLGAQAGKGLTLMVRAATDDGQPVLDLKPADVSLKVNGKAREIKSLTLVKFGAAPAAPAGGTAAPAASGAPAPFSTNGGGAAAAPSSEPSRIVWLAIDDESFVAGNELPARDAASQLVDALPAADRIGVMTVPHGTKGLSPTADRAAVKAAIAAVSGRGVGAGETDNDLACRTGITLQSIRGVLQTMPTDEPGVVVLFSGGMSAPETSSGKAGGSNTGNCNISTAEYQNVSSIALNVSSAFYVVHLKDAMTGSAARISSLTGGIEHLASGSGAGLIRFAGKGEGVMARIPKETIAFYSASFDPDASDKGATARIDLKSSRDKVKVRAASEISLKPAEAAAGGKTPSPKDMVRDIRAFRDLPLRATTVAQRNTGDDRIKVIVLFEPEAGTPLTSAVIGLVDDKGKLTAQWTAQDTELKSQPVLGVLAVPAGNYRVRVAAADSSGKAGAVDDAFTGALTAAGPSLKLSGLTLFAQTGTGIAPRLQFKDETEAIVLFELYGRPTGRLQAHLEIAKTVDGPAIGSPVQPGASGTAEPDKFTLSAKLPIADLAPGDYVIRAFLNEEGQPEGKVMRTLRKVAK